MFIDSLADLNSNEATCSYNNFEHYIQTSLFL